MQSYTPRHSAPAAQRRRREPPRVQDPALQEQIRRYQRERRRKRARRRRALLYGLLAAFLALFVLSAVRISAGRTDAVKGAWALDASTVYTFDGQGRGTLKLPLNTYDFSYTVRDGTLALDFTDPAVADAVYGCAVKADTLTLDNGGTLFTLVRQK